MRVGGTGRLALANRLAYGEVEVEIQFQSTPETSSARQLGVVRFLFGLFIGATLLVRRDPRSRWSSYLIVTLSSEVRHISIVEGKHSLKPLSILKVQVSNCDI